MATAWSIPNMNSSCELIITKVEVLNPPFKKEAAVEGYKAGEDGKGLNENPYRKFSAEYWSWHNGWTSYWKIQINF